MRFWCPSRFRIFTKLQSSLFNDWKHHFQLLGRGSAINIFLQTMTYWMTYWNNDKAVCRTALATPGLLNIIYFKYTTQKVKITDSTTMTTKSPVNLLKSCDGSLNNWTKLLLISSKKLKVECEGIYGIRKITLNIPSKENWHFVIW